MELQNHQFHSLHASPMIASAIQQQEMKP